MHLVDGRCGIFFTKTASFEILSIKNLIRLISSQGFVYHYTQPNLVFVFSTILQSSLLM